MILKILNLLAVVGFFSTLPLMVVIQYRINYYWDYVATQFRTDESAQVYDFIVVGSGSAGAVVANKISLHHKVLLLEAGGDPLFYNSIPGLALDMLHRPEVDWMYRTTPQKYSMQGMTGQKSLWPRGKLLGGTSNLNYMVYVRGSQHDYDNWANITGDPGWKFDNVLQHFKQCLDYNGKYKDDEKHYGQNPYGKLSVEMQKWGPLHETFVKGCAEQGIKEVDINGPQQTGVSKHEVAQKNGKRFGTYFAFLKDIQDRKNLRISRYSQAIKLKLDKNNRAVGVWYVQHGKKKYAKASKEIIVSGGSIDSPKLLMLSGIGDKKDLKVLRIKPRVDLPVGKTLIDHIATILLPFTIQPEVSLLPERDFGINTFTDYFLNGSGPLTCPTGFHSHAFFCTSVSSCNKNKDWPDIQLYMSSIGLYENLGRDFSRGFGVQREKIEEYLKPYLGKDGFIMMPIHLLPKSQGVLKLKDKNYESHPIIDPRYLEHPDDVKAHIDGIKMAIKIAQSGAFKGLKPTIPQTHFPGCEKHKFGSDAYWECYVRQWAFSVYHPVATCRMGRGIDDPKAVTDSKLRVLKTLGLRVADASIMPEIVSANTNAPTIMLGMKASDIIRDYWSQQFTICDMKDRLTGNDAEKCYYSKLA